MLEVLDLAQLQTLIQLSVFAGLLGIGNSSSSSSKEIDEDNVSAVNGVASSSGDISVERTDQGAVEAGQAMAEKGLKAVRDLVGQSNDELGDATSNALGVAQKTMKRSAGIAEEATQGGQQMSAKALDVAANASRSGESLDSETLIKWGAGAAAVLGVAMMWSKGK